MAEELNPLPYPARLLVADKAALRRILETQDRESGFVPERNATAQLARERMQAQGIRPEDNSFSCEIRRMREGE